MKKLMIGNEAVAAGALDAGVRLISAYPGTPSTEITEFAAKSRDLHVEWAPNEKVAAETAIGAAIGGARALCAMKHVGLNVAADPLYTAAIRVCAEVWWPWWQMIRACTARRTNRTAAAMR